jgi:hypothetical protein
MSANDDRGQEDTADLKDIDKILKKLVESLEKLNEKLDKNSKAFSANRDLVAEHSEQTKKNKLEIQASYFENLKAMAEFRKSLKESGGQFNFLTGLLKNGTSAVSVIGAITKKLDGMGSSFDELKRATKEVADFEDTIRQRMKDQNRTGKPEDNKDLLTDAERKQMGRAESSKDENKGADSKTNQFMSFGKEFFKKHAAGIAIGAAGAGTILKVLKMAFDASPMFQQVRKLLQFGVMMVLRPIGDFFGFLFRPIMIMLLRKFIIPWYTKLMPVMIHMGQLIGEKLAGAFEALAEGDVVKAFGILFADVTWETVFGDAFKGLATWVDNGLTGLTTNWDAFWTSTYTWFSTGIDTIIAPFSEIWGGLLSWFTDGITILTTASSWSDFWDKILTWFQLGLDGYVLQFGDLWGKIVTWLKDILPFGLGNVLFPDDGSTEETIEDTVERGADVVGGVATGAAGFFKDPLGSLTNAWDDFFGGGGDTNNNQEISININATGGSNGELAQTIKTEVAAAVQEIQTKGSPR